MYRVELLPAAHGDAIWIEYGPSESPTRVVIDGGPATRYVKGLLARLEALRQSKPKDCVIDLLVISHIDCDHIDGAVIFLQQCESLGIEVKEIWFNSYTHLGREVIDAFQPLQGEFLGALINVNKSFRERWNTSFRKPSAAQPIEESKSNDTAVLVGDEGTLPTINLPNGGRLTLLSPYQKQLSRLRRQWSAAIRGFSPGDEQSALERLRLRREYRPPDVVDVFSAGTYGGDRSAPNASSIAFILEHADRSCLFAADAHARVLSASLKRLASERGTNRIRLDAVKLPHHGSMGNVNEELLNCIDCDNWLISTNGAVFNHPDRATAELIAKKHSSPRFFCNYDVPSTRRLEPQKKDEAWLVEYPGIPPKPYVGVIGGLCVELTDPDLRPPKLSLAPTGVQKPDDATPSRTRHDARPSRKGRGIGKKVKRRSRTSPAPKK